MWRYFIQNFGNTHFVENLIWYVALDTIASEDMRAYCDGQNKNVLTDFGAEF